MAVVNFQPSTSPLNNSTGAKATAVSTTQQPTTANVTVPSAPQSDEGLSQTEIDDPNAITVTIADQDSPIVILFGPPGCGKTMTLVRLTRYLRDEDRFGTVEPIKTFRPNKDAHYASMCESFPSMIASPDAAEQTKGINFMLVEVKDQRENVICQILEAPGEFYFNPNDEREPNVNFPAYFNTIKSSKNRKIWCFMVVPDWESKEVASRYVQKIRNCNIGRKDKVIFVINQIDIAGVTFDRGEINMKELKRKVSNWYSGIFKIFLKKGLFWTSDDFLIVPFQTGTYTLKSTGGKSFQAGNDKYPNALWNTIMSLVRG